MHAEAAEAAFGEIAFCKSALASCYRYQISACKVSACRNQRIAVCVLGHTVAVEAAAGQIASCKGVMSSTCVVYQQVGMHSHLHAENLCACQLSTPLLHLTQISTCSAAHGASYELPEYKAAEQTCVIVEAHRVSDEQPEPAAFKAAEETCVIDDAHRACNELPEHASKATELTAVVDNLMLSELTSDTFLRQVLHVLLNCLLAYLPGTLQNWHPWLLRLDAL